MMTQQQNVKAILECNFAGFKDEIIDIACKGICQLRSSHDERMLDFIYDWLAEMWDHPCNYGFNNGNDREDVALYMEAQCDDWCQHCNHHTVKDCWKEYLETKFEEEKSNVKMDTHQRNC